MPDRKHYRGGWERDSPIDFKTRLLDLWIVPFQQGHSKESGEERGWQKDHGHNKYGLHVIAILPCC